MTRLPEPEQLEKFVDEPVFFRSPYEGVWSLQDNGDMVINHGDVKFVLEATNINVETAKDEWHQVSDIEYEFSHEDAYDEFMNREAREDFVCLSGIIYDTPDSPYQFEAYWIIRKVIFDRS